MVLVISLVGVALFGSSLLMFCVFMSQFLLNVYNPLARPVSWPVHLPVNGTVYNVTDSDGASVYNQVGVFY